MKKQILIAVQKLTVGGITSSLVNLIDYLNEKYPDTLEIDLFTFSSLKSAKNIPQNITLIHGNKLLELSATSFFDVLKSKNVLNIIIRIFLMMYVRVVGPASFYAKILKKHTNTKKSLMQALKKKKRSISKLQELQIKTQKLTKIGSEKWMP